MKQIVVNLTEEQLEMLDTIAEKMKQSRNHTIREAISVYVGMYLSAEKEKEKEKSELDQALD